MSSMKRRIFMGKAKSGKSNILKIVSIVAAILVAVGIIAVFVAPLIPVRKVDQHFVICMRIQTGVIMSDCNKQNLSYRYFRCK